MLLFTSGCKETSTTPDPINHDIVTTVTITLKPRGVIIDSLVAVWEDIDGVGGANPNRIDTLKLKADTEYICSIQVENRSVTPIVDITSEIDAERENHQFFYAITDSLGKVTVRDKDSRSLPVGLQFYLSTTVTASAVPGALTMSLSHWENAADKNGTTPSAETDVSIELPMIVR